MFPNIGTVGLLKSVEQEGKLILFYIFNLMYLLLVSQWKNDNSPICKKGALQKPFWNYSFKAIVFDSQERMFVPYCGVEYKYKLFGSGMKSYQYS